MTNASPSKVNRTISSAMKKISNGWCTGEEVKLVGNKEHYCAIGAIKASTTSEVLRDAAFERVHKVLVKKNLAERDPYWGVLDDIIDWNDGLNDKRRVLSVFREAFSI